MKILQFLKAISGFYVHPVAQRKAINTTSPSFKKHLEGMRKLMDQRTCPKCGAGKADAVQQPSPDAADAALGGTVWYCIHDGSIMSVTLDL